MGYINLKLNKSKGRNRNIEAILYILKQRKVKFETADAKTKGLGTYLIHKTLNNNLSKNKLTNDEVLDILKAMQREGLIYYSNDDFWVIDKKGVMQLDFERDQRGKDISHIIKKLY